MRLLAPGIAEVTTRHDLDDALVELRTRRGVAAVVARSGPVGEPDVPTPEHWRAAPALPEHDAHLRAVTAGLGTPTCWATLQDGRLVQDVLPIRGQEDQQTGHGSRDELTFHVEDSFSDDRCDVLALLCLRNPDRVPTTVATVGSLDPAGLDVAALAGPHFHIRPDPEHLRADPGLTARTRPVLEDGPRLRTDPAFTEADPGRPAAALAELHDQLARALTPIALTPGDVLLIDNRRAVHGRAPFTPRYRGADRWLRKLTTTYAPASGPVVRTP
ncbi:TauD/TfdA family dioxygenase [Actinokineospora bangkokensis]|uniref:TauD/TfdA-like domain-containing protein n=1 Tax=Actinokineospora bangkokensis TaxID=1193682 RepID=A0A1Q9LJP4_9PSEU|nr:TauD/TfdA family dioxygenase [Actinokineospora bangkokensis]OLR92214.1 hypothetical protein BJP25_23095 [Actinokineospora bangkokensis]